MKRIIHLHTRRQFLQSFVRTPESPINHVEKKIFPKKLPVHKSICRESLIVPPDNANAFFLALTLSTFCNKFK